MNSQQCADFQPRFLPHSVSLDSDGYMDMNGTARCPPPTTTTTTTSSMMTGIHTCMSVDSYMNTQVSEFNLHNASSSRLLDSGGRNLSMPNPDPMLHSRSRHPLPASGDVFPPRDRRPLTQDHELLLDKPEPEPEYTYIDAVSPPPDLPRRSSDGALLASRGRRHGTADDDLGRRNSDVKLEHRGSVSPSELQQVPGWSARVTERTVDHEMSRYINDDGNFIVWWYEVGRKYVISVSHLRSIRHYAVYESEREGKVWYYIFPKGARFTSLAALILHCQKHGVAEPTKTFKTPDGREAHRSSSGTSGRFSHVRLKYPIPARRN
ncbi:uncharacterized protein LOC143284889 [Babylonia areolata]|uniref:uncharacterized protein LOC143284889 n=1 Tax=Babylonia areolata TaxID=304850 RepID=UPI003FD47EF6